MGKKKNQASGIGRSIIKDRFGHGKRQKSDDTFLHTTELNDGYDWGRLNLQSVTEQSNLDEFLSTAQLAGTEFTAEKLNIKFIDPNRGPGLTDDERKQIKDAQDEHRQLLRIPRRPQWDENTTAEQLDLMERDAFLEWRRKLASLQEVEHIVMTPYEKNLDFWRQLWRVVERSDVVVQIVDARNPLLFRCEDIESYVKEVDVTKVNLLLVNKADYLTPQQRQFWSDYFTIENIRVVFWSALFEANRLKEEAKEESTEAEMDDSEAVNESEDENLESDKNEDRNLESDKDKLSDMNCENPSNSPQCDHITETHADSHKCSHSHQQSSQTGSSQTGNSQTGSPQCEQNSSEQTKLTLTESHDDISQFNSSEIVTGEKLLDVLGTLHKGKKYKGDVTTVGMIGYPNVGKSSTINAILKMKKVPVSATPGRTKHFQTLFVDPTLMLCDCPGLVFPSFVSTKADLVVNGILPIDQMRDHVPPVSLVCERIPRSVLETTFSINIPTPADQEVEADARPTAHELLNTYGMMRGFMTSNGLPDCPRSARYILKDYVNGKLLYCHAPPGVDVADFQPTPLTQPKHSQSEEQELQLKPAVPKTTSLDKEFFAKTRVSAHSKGTHGVSGFVRTQGLQQVSSGDRQSSVNSKLWKKHGNKNKKEKLRKIHAELDKH